MNKALPLLLILLLSAAAADDYFQSWEYLDDRCYENERGELRDFVIYHNDSTYRAASGMVVLDVEPQSAALEYVPVNSTAEFAGNGRPLIPGFDYPSTIALSLVNYTFFVPLEYASGKHLSVQVVGNTSDGYPRCTPASWELNDSHRLSDSQLSFRTNITFNPFLGKFTYNLTNFEQEPQDVYVAVFSGDILQESTFVSLEAAGHEEDRVRDQESKLQYESSDVSAGKYDIYMVSAEEGASYLEDFRQHDITNFFDFKMELPQVPRFHPGESYRLTLLVRNTGGKTDSYDIPLEQAEIPENWADVSIEDPGELDPGETGEVELRYSVPEYHVGETAIKLNLTSSNTGRVKTYVLELMPERFTTMHVMVEDIQKLQAYSNNNLTVKATASGTVSPDMYYYVYTEPALTISGGVGHMKVEVADVEEKTLNFKLGGSCVISDEHSRAYNAGRRMLMVASATYDLTSSPSNDSMETLTQLEDVVAEAKSEMTVPEAAELASNAERLASLMERFREAWDYGLTDYTRSLREDLNLFIVEMEGALRDAGYRMSEQCSSVDQVRLYVSVLDVQTMTTKEVPRMLPVEGPKVLELVGPQEVKAISGSSVTINYRLQNNAGESFEVEVKPGSDIIYATPYVYLPYGSTKDMEVRIRPPENQEFDGMKTSITLETRTYTLKFPLEVTAGPFEPRLVTDSGYVLSPGQDGAFNVTLRTGGMDDIFKVNLNGPSWMEAPGKVITENGEATITVRASPPESASNREYVEISVIPESFPEYTVHETFDVMVSNEARRLKVELDQYQKALEQRKEEGRIGEQTAFEVSLHLNDAAEYIRTNEFNRAGLELQRAQRKLFSGDEEEGDDYTIFIIAGVLAAFIGVFWKFLLPKIRGTMNMGEGAGEEESGLDFEEEVI